MTNTNQHTKGAVGTDRDMQLSPSFQKGLTTQLQGLWGAEKDSSYSCLSFQAKAMLLLGGSRQLSNAVVQGLAISTQ